MSRSPVQTTLPGSDTTDADSPAQAPVFGLVIAGSDEEPDRVGEIAWLPAFEWVVVGRDEDDVQVAAFGRQRPGETFAPRRRGLAGKSISHHQLRLRATAVAVEVEVIGKCLTLINGEKRTTAKLQEGGRILLKGQALLLCVRRPRVLPRLVHTCPTHPFGEPDAAGIVGESPAAWQLREDLAVAALRDNAHVLIRGESGTGKEMAAAVIHRLSSRAKGPFVTNNASSFTGSLIDSELFGNGPNYPNPGCLRARGWSVRRTTARSFSTRLATARSRRRRACCA